MSNSSNQVVSTWEIVEAKLRRSPFRFQGQKLSDQHSLLVADAFSLWYLAGDDLLRSMGDSRESVDTRWINLLVSTDLKDVFSALKDADLTLLTSEFTSYDAFKRHLRCTYPFIGDLLSPMSRVFASWFTCEDQDAFDACHCWLCFPSRLNLPGLRQLKEKGLNDYLAREELLPSDGFTEEEASLISSWFPRTLALDQFYVDHFRPRHGNGSTADAGKSKDAKYKALGRDLLTDYLDKRVGDQSLPGRERGPFSRTAKLRFVPKSMLTYRSISMEPATLMWYQQGVLAAFVSDLEKRRRHPLKGRFHPGDQQSNRDLAFLGSIDRGFATIDLSDASDSVSWALVKQWFRKSVLYRWLLCTRSSRVTLPDGTELAMKKFAPMGSALCFPTECIVFAAITECAIKEAGGDPVRSQYRVYGDDIVVESEYAPAVITRLEKNGFSVNNRKSFITHHATWCFRESCGGEYLDGRDITPDRLSRWFSGLIVDRYHPGRILSLIELANDCNSRLPSVRRRCIHALSQLYVDYRVKFGSTGEGHLFSTQPTNWHLLPPVWSEDYQAWYVRHGHESVPTPARVLQDEDIRLFEYLRLTDGRKRLIYPEDRTNVDIAPVRAGKWTRTRSPVEG